eukprot:6305818-Lingulodinium_polyedra.AAC.1
MVVRDRVHNVRRHPCLPHSYLGTGMGVKCVIEESRQSVSSPMYIITNATKYDTNPKTESGQGDWDKDSG